MTIQINYGRIECKKWNYQAFTNTWKSLFSTFSSSYLVDSFLFLEKNSYNMTLKQINVFRSQEITERKRLNVISWLKELFLYHPSLDILPSPHPNSIRNSTRNVSSYCNCCRKGEEDDKKSTYPWPVWDCSKITQLHAIKITVTYAAL